MLVWCICILSLNNMFSITHFTWIPWRCHYFAGIALVQPGGERELCQSASGEYHVEGESWALDSCTQCLCHAGTVLCESPVCPPVLCHYPVKPAGTCCAVCKGESSPYCLIPSAWMCPAQLDLCFFVFSSLMFIVMSVLKYVNNSFSFG